MQHHARGYVDLRGSWYLYGQERLGRVYPDNEPGSPDHPESRINSGSHTGSRPDHAGTRTDHASHRTGSHRITSRTHRITSGSHVPEHARITHHTGPDHTGSRPEHTGSRPDHVPEHVRITYQTAGPDQHRITSGDHAGTLTSGDHAGTHRITSGRHGRIRARHTRYPSSSIFFHLAISSPWNLSRGARQMAHEEKCAPLM